MDNLVSGKDTSSNIFAAFVAIGAISDLQEALAKDFEGTFQQLERIPEEIIRIVLSGEDSGSEGSLGECIFYIQEVIEKILRQHHHIHPPKLEDLEKYLHASLDKALISLESLRLIEKYLQSFCNKYPPQRIPDWENPTEADYEDHEARKRNLGGHEGVLQEGVGKNEKMTLLRAIRAIQQYITYINTLSPPGRCLHPDKAQALIAKESLKINSMKRIINILRGMFDWGDNNMPYRALCAHGEPLGPNLFHESCADLFDTISTWERICKRLNLNEKKD